MQSRENVYPVYKYVKEITDADIDNLDDSHNGFKEGFKLYIRKLKLNDEINILNSKMPNGWFLYEKKMVLNSNMVIFFQNLFSIPILKKFLMIIPLQM